MNCSACQLCKNATSMCPGRPLEAVDLEGWHPSIMIVGEAPDAEDDRSGKCWSGRAGHLLKDCCTEAGARDVYLTNLVKCFPKGQEMGQPSAEEIDICTAEQLFGEIEKLDPKVIICTGAAALRFFAPAEMISKVHGTVLEWQTRKLVPMFHPGAVLKGAKQKHELISAIRTALVEAGEIKEKSRTSKIVLAMDKETFDREMDQIFAFCAGADKPRWLSVDVETGGPETQEEKERGAGVFRPYDPSGLLLSIAISHKPGYALAIPYEHPDSPWDSVEKEYVQQRLSKLFMVCAILGHNFPFDMSWLRVKGFTLSNIAGDSMLLSWILFGRDHRHGLEDLASIILGVQKHKDVIRQEKSDKNTKSLTFCDLAKVLYYNALDAEITLRLYRELESQVHVADLVKVVDTLMGGRAMWAHHTLQANGMKVDVEAVNALATELEKRKTAALADVEACGFISNAMAISGNLWTGSDSDVAALVQFVSGVEIKNDWLTKKGLLSISQDVLQEIRNHMAAVGSEQVAISAMDRIIAYREALISGRAIKSLQRDIYPDGFVHPSYGICTSATGRDTCQSPAIHSFPKNCRHVFVSRHHDGLILSADHKQAEVRVLAMTTQDANLIQDLKSGDVYEIFANGFGRDRDTGKTVLLSAIYGQEPAGLAMKIGCTEDEAREFQKTLWERYPAVRSYISQKHYQAEHSRVVKSLSGWPRYFRLPIGFEERREAQNSPIQGDASHITYQGMERVEARLDGYGRSCLIAFIHDNLVLDVVPQEIPAVVEAVEYGMLDYVAKIYPWTDAVPLELGWEIGVNWGRMVDLDFIDEEQWQLTGPEVDVLAVFDKLLGFLEIARMSEGSVKLTMTIKRRQS